MGDDAEAALLERFVAPHRRVHGVGHSLGGAALALAAPPFRVAPFSVALRTDNFPRRRSGDRGGVHPMADGAARRRSSFDSYADAIANYAAKPPLNSCTPPHSRPMSAAGSPRAMTAGSRCAAPRLPRPPSFGGGAERCGGALPQLDLPVAIVAGRQEESGPGSFGPAALTQLQRGTFVERRHLGHFGPLEDPHGRRATSRPGSTPPCSGGGEGSPTSTDERSPSSTERKVHVATEALLLMDLQNGVVERFAVRVDATTAGHDRPDRSGRTTCGRPGDLRAASPSGQAGRT